ncbi:MAG: DUF6580 family putative transport protein [Chitinophagales bacterium]
MKNKTINSTSKLVIAMLVITAIVSLFIRLMPHIPNFTPIGAMCLFAGAYVSQRKLAIFLPLLALFISDLVLHVSYLQGFQEFPGFYESIYINYIAFACMVLMASFGLKNKANWFKIPMTTFAASIAFFLVSNLGVWLTSTVMYMPKSLATLVECYVAAIPFFWTTLAADLCYTTVLFGAFFWLKKNAFSNEKEMATNS